ncbi:MAG: nitronate monooxygenase [Catonella sp.]|nr:nitronate monooxygenase [Catonella sp.]MDY6355824.1 nitronate monooxygenase [Catonella sp.]
MKKLLNEILGIKYPFIQGGMANIATGEFAAACSNAGALGIIGSGGMNAEKLLENIDKCEKLTDKPFGVNLMLMNPDTDAMAEVVARKHVKVVTTGAGSPGKYISMWKDAGITVIPVTASVMLAQRLIKDGADMIIAEGGESGGHVGEMSTITLVPQMVDAVDVPVIAAGGIADGRSLVAALSLGAIGVQMGTCLLVSTECPIHENYKNELIKAKDNSTTVTGRSVNAPTRIIKNKMARQYIRREREGADRMELEKFTLGSLRKAVFDGNIDEGSLMAGEDCGELKEIRPVADIFSSMVNEANEIMDNFGSDKPLLIR